MPIFVSLSTHNEFIFENYPFRYPTKKTIPIIGIFRYNIVVWWSVQSACVCNFYLVFFSSSFDVVVHLNYFYGSTALQRLTRFCRNVLLPLHFDAEVFYHIIHFFLLSSALTCVILWWNCFLTGTNLRYFYVLVVFDCFVVSIGWLNVYVHHAWIFKTNFPKLLCILQTLTAQSPKDSR